MSQFYTTQRAAGKDRLRRPDGRPEFSIGLNHIDGAGLRYPDSGDVWRRRYGNSQEQWLGAVGRELSAWGFNAVGWVQEVVVINDHYHRHSRNFTPEEYRWLGMPFCHMLPFTDAHQWEDEVRLPDVMHPDFEEWCDYVARDHCSRLADDPNLIGYFYSDCPVWAHTRTNNHWRGTLLDPWLPPRPARENADTPAAHVSPERAPAATRGSADIRRDAEQYYRVTHAAIRRYDRNHLILGDRYEANAPLPGAVVDAALPFVDVLSFQCFGEPEHIHTTLSSYARKYDAPVLLADAAGFDAHDPKGFPPKASRLHSIAHYRRTMELLATIPQCVGYHLCGALIRNRTRRYGLKDERDTAIAETVEGLSTVNRWMQERRQSG